MCVKEPIQRFVPMAQQRNAAQRGQLQQQQWMPKEQNRTEFPFGFPYQGRAKTWLKTRQDKIY
jgi:hypothetical protein